MWGGAWPGSAGIAVSGMAARKNSGVRVVNRVVVGVLALVLCAAGVLVALEAIPAGLGRGAWVLPRDEGYRALVEHPWSAPEVQPALGGVFGFGLVLVVAQLVPRRRPRVSLPPAGDCEVVISRRNVERALARAAAVPGVSKTGVDLRARKVRVSGEAAFGLTAELKPNVAKAVEQRLRQIGVDPEPAVTVSLRRER